MKGGHQMTFYERLSKYYDIIFKTGDAQLELIQSLVPERKRILDIGSGTGTYTIPLAKMGYQLVALDYDQGMIDRLRDKADALELQIDSFARDMMGLDDLIEDAYDGILCIGNTLPHLADMNEVKRFLKIVYDKLGDNGVLIIQTVNYDRVYKHNVTKLPLIDRPENGVRFDRSYDMIDDQKIRFIGKLDMPDGTSSESSTVLLGIRAEKLLEALDEAGYSQSESYGSFAKDPWSDESYATVVVARK